MQRDLETAFKSSEDLQKLLGEKEEAIRKLQEESDETFEYMQQQDLQLEEKEKIN